MSYDKKEWGEWRRAWRPSEKSGCERGKRDWNAKWKLLYALGLRVRSFRVQGPRLGVL